MSQVSISNVVVILITMASHHTNIKFMGIELCVVGNKKRLRHGVADNSAYLSTW